MGKRVLIVGQCGVDGPWVEEFVDSLGGVSAERVQDEEALVCCLEGGCDLVLFNRELVGDFDEQEGVELMRRLREEYPEMKLMLVSDRAEAQKEAVGLGAVKGFGKAELEEDPARVGEVLRGALR